MPVRLARYSGSCVQRSRTAGRIALAALLLLFGCQSLQTAVADGGTRTLSFQHTHRDDSITVTFKRNGRYDEDGLKKLNHFLRDWRNNDETRMDPQLFDILWEVSRDVGVKEPVIHIISSYRSPVTNAMLRRRSRGVAQFSQHTLGKAIDFSIPGAPLDQIRAAGLRLQRGGVGFYPSSGFVHVDVGSIRHWPRMTHDQLARVFPDGKTVHVPSDGHPLKNYSAALAEVQRRGSTPSATSLAAAQNAGIKTADASGAAPGRGRNVLAKLLGIGSNEEDEGETTPPARGRKVADASPTPASQEAPLPPMPRARPAKANEFFVASTTKPAAPAAPAKPGEFTLASASTSAVATPTEIIRSRGFWQEPPDDVTLAGSSTLAANKAEPGNEAMAPTGERLAWIKGPDGRRAPPRPPKDIDLQTPVETTASLNSWTSNPSQNDRVPTDLALAYAAAGSAAAPAEPVAKPATSPMGALKPIASANAATAPSTGNATVPPSADNATVATRKAAVNSPAAKIGQRGFDPWLRGVIMTPSVHHSLDVAVVGAKDARTLRPLMHKPDSTVAMVFSNDPTLGLTSLKFSGAAVAFLPTVDMLPRTARLLR